MVNSCNGDSLMDILTYATMQVVIDAQAWLYAIITVGGDAPEDEFRAAEDQFKKETAGLIEQAVVDLAAVLAGTEDEDESVEQDDNEEI
jgi:hypothetical protein